MNGNRTIRAFALLTISAALALAGCGGSDNSGGAYGGEGSGATTSGSERGAYGGEKTAASNSGGEGATFVSLGNVPKLGLVLVDSKGFTLYDFHKDRGTTSACYGACSELWPPLLTEGAPQPSNGTSASKLGTTKRKDGTMQVTYAGHPLYTFTEDTKPGEANGNDLDFFGGEWYALQGSGEDAEG